MANATKADLAALKREIMKEVGELLINHKPVGPDGPQPVADSVVAVIDERINGFARNLLHHNGRAPFELRASSVRFHLKDYEEGTFLLDMTLENGGPKQLAPGKKGA